MNIITVDRVRILVADVLVALRSLPDNSVDCVVTSPPYWALRDYGVAGQIGLEPTLAEHLAVMVEVFEEVRRVLAPDGTLWVNYGDCFASKPNGRPAAEVEGDNRAFRDKPVSTIDAGVGLKPKDLCLIPYRLAIALQQAGWWVRSNIVWAKPNPMPESAQDRPGNAHEQIFMFTKSARYWYDARAVRQSGAGGHAPHKTPAGWDQGEGGHGTIHRDGRATAVPAIKKVRGHEREQRGFRDDWDKRTKAEQQAAGRNLRNYEPAMTAGDMPLEVWEMATRPFPGAHFATFPPDLAYRCIQAGCKPGGVVLDPFGGSGTTGLVASALNRDAILIELNPEYAEIARKRCAGEPIPRVGADAGTDDGQADLFGEAA